MEIAVIGSGYVGSVTGALLASSGNKVTLCDISEEKINAIKSGKSPIYEPGLEEHIRAGLKSGNLSATTDIPAALANAAVIFVCVGTPPKADGSTDLSYILSAAREIGKTLPKREDCPLIVIKSTVPPGTTKLVSEEIEQSSNTKEGLNFGTAMNPEFLKEGTAVADFEHPDRLVFGVNSKRGQEILQEVYKKFECPIVVCDPKTAEMIKYASNSMLAVRISFTNEIANSCKHLGIDTFKVMEGMGLDSRIGNKFLNPGIGFGGSCFPKDVSSLAHTVKESSVDPLMLEAALKINLLQPGKLVSIAEKKLGNLKRKISVLGLAFKPDTDDVRESPAVKIVQLLVERGAEVMVYDPEARDTAQEVLGKSVKYANGLSEALNFSDAVFILTDWEEFKDPKLYEGKIVFEGRKLFKDDHLNNFEGVCW